MLEFARRRAFLAIAGLPLSAAALNAQTCPDAASLTRSLAEPLATIGKVSRSRDEELQGRLVGFKPALATAPMLLLTEKPSRPRLRITRTS